MKFTSCPSRTGPEFSVCCVQPHIHIHRHTCNLVAISCTFPIIIIELVSVPFIEIPRMKKQKKIKYYVGPRRQWASKRFYHHHHKKCFWHLSGGDEKKTREQHTVVMYFSTSNYIRCMCLTNVHVFVSLSAQRIIAIEISTVGRHIKMMKSH